MSHNVNDVNGTPAVRSARDGDALQFTEAIMVPGTEVVEIDIDSRVPH